MLRREFVSLLPSAYAAAQKAIPNVVVILADDLGTGDVASYNPESKIRTPNLDRVARQGMRFTDAHSPSSVCTPTRYGLLTGRYCWRSRLKSGVLNGYSPRLIEERRPTIASLLKQAGYSTGGFGKWHLGLGTEEKTNYDRPFAYSPLDQGFDEYYGIPASLDMPPYVLIDGNRAEEAPTGTIPDNGETKRGPYWRGGPRAPSFAMDQVLPKITKRAEGFIRQSKTPYFAYIPLPAPHTPWVPSKEFLGRSKAKLYGDFVEQLDDSIGRILKAIDDTGQANNTLLIVTSDNGAPWEKRDMEENGGHWANRLLRGQKSDAFEGGHRIPFLARHPGKIKAGSVSGATICLTDIFATSCAAAGISPPKDSGEDSFAIQPAFQGQRKIRPHIVHHSGDGLFAIRQDNWKLILGLGSGGFTAPARIAAQPGGPSGQLFDLATDPNEREDLYSKNPPKVKELTSLLRKIQSDGHS